MALGIAGPRIPVMIKKHGAYRRDTAKPKRAATHFLRQWRERPTDEFPNGMTQEELADRSGLSLSSISAYETGGTDPSLDALQKLSTALGVPRGMITDIDPSYDPDLWTVYLQLDGDQRETLGRMAAGLVEPKRKKRP